MYKSSRACRDWYPCVSKIWTWYCVCLSLYLLYKMNCGEISSTCHLEKFLFLLLVTGKCDGNDTRRRPSCIKYLRWCQLQHHYEISKSQIQPLPGRRTEGGLPNWPLIFTWMNRFKLLPCLKWVKHQVGQHGYAVSAHHISCWVFTVCAHLWVGGEAPCQEKPSEKIYAYVRIIIEIYRY